MPDVTLLLLGACAAVAFSFQAGVRYAERRRADRDAARASLPTLHSPALQQAPLYGLPNVTPDPLTAAERMALAAFKARCGGRDE
jgi:hypothetical protein